MKRSRTGHRHLLIASGACVLVVACVDRQITGLATPKKPPGPSRDITYSADFYKGSDGFYYWDGQPPALDGTDIADAFAGGMAPRPNTYGWVSGTMDYTADQYDLDLVYTLTDLNSGNAYLYNAAETSGWVWANGAWSGSGFGNRSQEHGYYSKSLSTGQTCGLSLQNGGTGYVRNAIPFGISLSYIKFTVNITPGTITWSDQTAPLQANNDPGVYCDQDLSQYTGTYADDPANQTQSGGGSGPMVDGYDGGQQGVGVSPEPSSGTWYCSYWTDWWYSQDGGETWRWTSRDCWQWEYAE